MKNNTNGKGLSLAIQKKGKFQNSNSDIAVNIDHSLQGDIDPYTVHRSKLRRKCRKQLKLLMIVDGKNRFYTAIKNISRFLSKLSRKKPRVSLLHGLCEWLLDRVTSKPRCLLEKKKGL